MMKPAITIFILLPLCTNLLGQLTSVNASSNLTCKETQEIITLCKSKFQEIKGVEDTHIRDEDARHFKSKKQFGINGTTYVFDSRPDYNRVGLSFIVYQGNDKVIGEKVFNELMTTLDQCLLKTGFEKIEGGIPDVGKLQHVTYFNGQVTFDIAQRTPYGTSTPALFVTVTTTVHK